ncbi:MAG: carboxypeptidase-like regulatory domain-containing protein [Bacteroidetes bacterium]|nr:MAG: carboxypeptidase-like regulatory domain-containing protein [Bacteroidota bacterium]
MKPILVLFTLVIPFNLFCQTSLISGKILNQKDGQPIPYANIFNQTTQKGTISNLDGFFQIEITGPKDSVLISFIGFRNSYIKFQTGRKFYEIKLEESLQLLNEIVVTPKENSFLFDLIDSCKKNASENTSNSKAYFELKTFRNDIQLELVEGFYNAGSRGYELNKLDLKASRIALQTYHNRFFSSLESSRAITLFKSLKKSPYFPSDPPNLSKRKAKRNFFLYLEKKYLNNEGDSIFVIEFQPRNQSKAMFSGQIWINKTKMDFIKIKSICKNCKTHPFLPLFPSDSIIGVDLEITKSFKPHNKEMVFNHIDFTYQINYKSRISKPEELNFSIRTNAVLFAYNHLETFFIPKFSFSSPLVGDYRKINAMPYNKFFWENHDEYCLNDQQQMNQAFFAEASHTNNTIFNPGPQFNKGFLEHPFVHWSPNRVSFSEIRTDTIEQPFISPEEDQFNLAVKIFLDINTYQDSTNILTATVFDPYDSYFYPPINDVTNCFINMYFDWCEIQRRNFQKTLETSVSSPETMNDIIEDFYRNFNQQRRMFLKKLKLGNNEAEMEKWNAYIYQELGIDNFRIFDPFPEDKE